MAKALIIAAASICISGYSWFYTLTEQPTEKKIAATLVAQADTFARAVNELRKASLSPAVKIRELQHLFLQTRLAYKKMEWAAEYFAPTVSRAVNGPPVEEIEGSANLVVKPQGLQMIEPLLYPAYHAKNRNKLLQQIELLQSSAQQFKSYFSHVDLYNWQIFDAGKLEIYRLITLGITGFDTALCGSGLPESEASLNSLKQVFTYYAPAGDSKFPEQFTAAQAYIANHQNFSTFNRAEFITVHANALTTAISRLQKQLNLPVVKYNRLLNQDAPTLFADGAFNPDAYAPVMGKSTALQIALGKRLFSDAGLSGTGTRSCASCHQPGKAFTDGFAKNTILGGQGFIGRNTPTLLNAALQPLLFYDMRSASLEDQALEVIQNKNEMHGSLKTAAAKLWRDTAYQRLFNDAYPVKQRQGIDTLEAMNAIAAYLRSLTKLNSRFDNYMRGDKNALSENEVDGFNLFMGKARCATCHYAPLFNGVLPPKYISVDAEIIGVPAIAGGKLIDPDPGRYATIPRESQRYAFKTPTVRNAGLTAPYMHNGIYKTLEEVLDFYNKGGGAGAGIKVPGQTLSSDNLHLTPAETADIIAFIRSLDSR